MKGLIKYRYTVIIIGVAMKRHPDTGGRKHGNPRTRSTKPRDPFAAILLTPRARKNLTKHYETARPHVDPRDLRTWRYESVYQLATRGEAFARYLAKTGRIAAAARWQKTADAAMEELARRKEG